jgi:DNA helicase-2/ATP-dependent DNA helicase PcrA
MIRRRRKISLLDGLNEEQRKVVQFFKGALLVVAVAGSGKTRALIHRIAYLIKEHMVDPSTILAVTFSKKAADEMNNRLLRLGVNGCRVGTWHSLCLEILRTEIDYFDISKWEIDTKDRYRVIVKKILGWEKMKWNTADLTKVISFIGLCKASAALPGSKKAMSLARQLFDENPCNQNNPRLLNEAYFHSEEARVDRYILTFDDMLVEAHQLLSRNEDIRVRWASRFDFVLQDEAQDQNLVQAEIAQMLARDHRNYMVVGDPGQSIYKFRGAIPERLLSFEKEWNAEIVKMNKNYRSADEILSTANGIISSMSPKTHLGVMMEGMRELKNPVELFNSEDMDQEGETIVRDILERHESGLSWRDSAVLYRTNAQSRAVEESLISNKVPYVIVGGTNFYMRKEVQDLLSYLKVATDRAGEVEFGRCINTPFRYLGKAFIKKVLSSKKLNNNWINAVENALSTARIQHRQKTSAYEWIGLIEGLIQSIHKRNKVENFSETLFSEDDNKDDGIIKGPRLRDFLPAALLERIIKETKFMEHLTRDEGAETVENNRVSNVRELIRAAERFTTVSDFLDYIDNVIQSSKNSKTSFNEFKDRVTLISIHRSKGLEWNNVYIIGSNEKIIPHGRSTDIDEERRLFYVGVTRAMDSLTISYVNRASFGPNVLYLEPSRFIEEGAIEVL